MRRPRQIVAFFLSGVVALAACEVAHAEEPAGTEARPGYTLDVVSDDPAVISYDALRPSLATELGDAVGKAGPPGRAAVVVRYRTESRELTVRVEHPGGRVLERTVRAEGDPGHVQREAVLLAGNLARDEARELLEALASRPAASPAPGVSPAPVKSAPTAVEAPEPDVHANVAFVHPLATNFGKPNATAQIDLSVLYGRIGRVEALQLGGAVVVASRSVTGLQLGGLGAAAGGDVSGAQIAGGLAVSGGLFEGLQMAGITTISLGDVGGVRVAGVANIGTRKVTGLDVAGLFDFAGTLEGAQLAPINVVGNAEGVQLGIVNVARKVTGVQLGVVNVAEEVDGAALGLVSISRHSVHPTAWASNLAYTNLGFKFGVPNPAKAGLYTALAFGYGTRETDFDNFATHGTLGGHIPLPLGFDLDAEAMFTNVLPRTSSRRDDNLWLSGHLLPGYSFARHFRIFAGGGARFPIDVSQGRSVVRPEILAGIQL